jgi:hypothetical protein
MRRRVRPAFFFLLAASSGGLLADGCSATPTNTFPTGSGAGPGGASSASGTGGEGGMIIIIHPDGGEDASDASDDVATNPCGTKCGTTELCDTAHTGLDDNCDGLVDEGCPCSAGQAHFCFKGDPSYRNVPGCFDGTEICTEQGTWGPCVGGVHAVSPDNCFLNDTSVCHAITSPPFADVHLKTGTGQFSANALAGTETFTVQCPTGVSQCPAVSAPDNFKPLQSGEYTVTYTKHISGDPNPKQCTYPLFVGAPGLRIELSWEHSTADDGVDLDLHVHQPNNTQPWGISPGKSQDCTWINCVESDFESPGTDTPKWFADPPVMPPTPVNWWLDPVMQNNTCYNDPRGVGLDWQSFGMGCHNPRLDADNISCKFAETNPNAYDFCTPENINIDFPPKGEWVRIGIHYYSSHSLGYEVHPEIKIFCNGGLAADLGPQGYYDPETPVTFAPFEGSGGPSENRFWIVADVAFSSDVCGKELCVVKPVYSDPVNKTPFLTLGSAATSHFDPGYPPPP